MAHGGGGCGAYWGWPEPRKYCQEGTHERTFPEQDVLTTDRTFHRNDMN